MNNIISLKNIETQSKVGAFLDTHGITLADLSKNKIQVSWLENNVVNFDIFAFRIESEGLDVSIISTSNEGNFGVYKIILSHENEKFITMYNNTCDEIDYDDNTVSIVFI